MKKIALLLIVALVLGISVMAYAGSTKYILEQGLAASGSESGFVIVHWVKEGKAIGQFQVRGLTPGDYWAYVEDPPDLPMVLEKLKVNQKGSGHLHVMGDDAEPSDGFWLGIADTDTGITSGNVVLVIWVPQLP